MSEMTSDAEKRELEKKHNAAVANGLILRARAIARRLDVRPLPTTQGGDQ